MKQFVPSRDFRDILSYTNPKQAQKMAYKYLGKKNGTLYRSTKKDKKYMVFDPNEKHWVHFGQVGYEDYTKHKNKTRRKNYLTRSTHIKGNWKRSKYTPNSLSIHVLW